LTYKQDTLGSSLNVVLRAGYLCVRTAGDLGFKERRAGRNVGPWEDGSPLVGSLGEVPVRSGERSPSEAEVFCCLNITVFLTSRAVLLLHNERLLSATRDVYGSRVQQPVGQKGERCAE